MKKIASVLAVLLCVANLAKAQEPQMAKLIVHYKFSHMRDTTNRDKPYTENMVLFLGQSASVYKSYDRKLQEALMRKQVADQIAEQKGSGGPMNIKITNKMSSTNTEYFQFPADGKFMRKERLITPYLVEEKMPEINWKISPDTLTLGGMHCQKAMTHFKGRDYTAWFSPDLPFHSGPWKLNGLPGLILEAYDKNKEVVFKFDSMEEAVAVPKSASAAAPEQQQHGGFTMIGMDDPNVDPNLIAVPTDAVRTTEKEFNNLRDAMRKDPNAFAQGAMNSAGGNMRGAPGGAGGPGGPVMKININGNGPVINNPLELPEKK
jgi:GLPGLI family protein